MDSLTTKNLVLRHLAMEDAAFILALLNSPGWLKYIGDRGVHSVESATNYLVQGPLKSYRENGFGLYKVELRERNIAIGMCGLIKRETLKDVDIGFAFLPDYIGKGYGFEAASAVLKLARDEFHLPRIVAITLEENHASVGLLKKLGMHFEEKIIYDNTLEELVLYGIDLA